MRHVYTSPSRPMNRLLQASLAVVLVALPATAHAAPAAWGSPVSPACAFSGVASFNWGTGVDYVDCIGAFSGNTSGAFESGVLAKLTSAWGPSWDVLAAPTANTATGVLTFSEVIGGRFAIGLKQGNAFSLYLFNADDPISTMRYTSAGVQAGASTEIDLSHATLYGTHGGVNITCVAEECTTTQVPEPASYALMAAGLLGLIGTARRRTL